MTKRIKLNCTTAQTTTVDLTDAEKAEVAAIKNAEPERLKEVKRQKRNVLLAETDWMSCSDVTMSDSWKTYRQALRDLPTQSGFPDVDFPTKPS